MHLVQQIVVLVHLVGFAALLGGLLVQTRSAEPEVNATMVWGGWTTLASGAGLVALALAAGGDVGWGPVAVKAVVTLFLVLLLVRNRRFLSVPRGLWLLMGLLTLLNAALSVLWR
ncbi:hypothetical protein GCM10009616_21580 [Microlunatus lacustris]